MKVRTKRLSAPSKSPSSAILLFFLRSASACFANSSGLFVELVPVAAFRFTNSLHALSKLATKPASPLKLLFTVSAFFVCTSNKASTYALGSTSVVAAPPSPTNFETAARPAFLTCSSNFFLRGSRPSGIRERRAYIRCRSSSLSKSSRFWKDSHISSACSRIRTCSHLLMRGLRV